jgi:hypothetical protein
MILGVALAEPLGVALGMLLMLGARLRLGEALLLGVALGEALGVALGTLLMLGR